MRPYNTVLIIGEYTKYKDMGVGWNAAYKSVRQEADLIIEVTKDKHVRVIKDRYSYVIATDMKLYPFSIDHVISNYIIPLESCLQLEKIKNMPME